MDEKVKEQRVHDLLYCETRYINLEEGRYPCVPGIHPTVALYKYSTIARRYPGQVGSLGPTIPIFLLYTFFREQHRRFLPAHKRRGAWRSWLGLRGKHSPEVRLLEQYTLFLPPNLTRNFSANTLSSAGPYITMAVLFQGQGS